MNCRKCSRAAGSNPAQAREVLTEREHRTEQEQGNVAQMAQVMAGARRSPTLAAAGRYAMDRWSAEVETAARRVDGVTDARVKLVWSPPWDRDRMSEEAKLELGLM